MDSSTGWLLDVSIEQNRATIWLKTIEGNILKLSDAYQRNFYVLPKDENTNADLFQILAIYIEEFQMGDIMNPTIPLDKSTCLKLVSKNVFEAGRPEEAFERQGTDIVVLNVTRSQFGDLFAALAYGEDNHGYELIDVTAGPMKALNT
jgi:hypothetical protein